MSTSKTPDETPKRKIAKKVVSPKRLYFSPDLGRSVEASDEVEASELVAKELNQEEVGDASAN